ATYAYVPSNGDVITVKMTSNAVCATNSPATSNAVTMVINPLVPASVTISADVNNVCAGTQVTFTALPQGGGTTPVYQWYKGAATVGTNSATYAYVPLNGDKITVKMTSNAVCATGSPATSNEVTMVINPSIAVSVTIAASLNPVGPGVQVTFTPTPVNGGTLPTYEWFVNSTSFGNGNTYLYSPVDGDQVYSIMTSNASGCLSGNPAMSNIITMSVSPGTGLGKEIGNVNIYSIDKNIIVHCSIDVKQIKVYNAVGSMVKSLNNTSDINKISMAGNPVGCYIVSLISDNEIYTGKVILK
ncbi:MAG: T9SS type A sorting domain-containing protein, partial [Paludibacter sp.]|nr:T9SS type A sorting domain-containing protein [Paludibacter sp.]